MAKKGVTIKDVDHGYRKLVATVLGLQKDRPQIAVGVLASDAGKSEGATTVLDIATWNEFGTKDSKGERIPARSFIRGWFDENRAQAQKRLKGLLQKVIKGDLTEDQALEQFGLWAQAGIQQRMAQGIPPPNAESTVKQKGSSTPLIDTGVLRSSVSFEIRKG
jgi:hypothetical protein